MCGDHDWTFGASSADLTRAYVPDDYTDIYYLLDSTGRVDSVNGEPASADLP